MVRTLDFIPGITEFVADFPQSSHEGIRSITLLKGIQQTVAEMGRKTSGSGNCPDSLASSSAQLTAERLTSLKPEDSSRQASGTSPPGLGRLTQEPSNPIKLILLKLPAFAGALTKFSDEGASLTWLWAFPATGLRPDSCPPKEGGLISPCLCSLGNFFHQDRLYVGPFSS